MNQTAQLAVNLIRSQLCGDAFCGSPPDEVQLQKLYKFSSGQDLSNIVGKALFECGMAGEGHIAQAFFNEQYGAVMRYQKQQYELDRLCSALSDAHICHVPLKGAVIRRFYPEPEMRTSSDIDVLVHKDDLEAARHCLEQKLGAKYMLRSEHDVSYMTENGVHIELHHSLAEDEFLGSNVLSKAWDYVLDSNSYTKEFISEFFIYFHIAHMAKHFVMGGFGIRFILDLWLINQKMNYDPQKLDALVADGGLSSFAKACNRVASVWFECKNGDDETSLLEKYIFDSGIYGNLEQYVILSQNKQGGKFKNMISRVFLSPSELALNYPKVEKYPALYPWYMIVRFFRIVFKSGGQRAIEELKLNSSSDASKKQEIENLLNLLDIK